MKVTFTPEAANTLYFIADFVKAQNTPGSGKRYALRFRKAIERIAQPNVQYALCNYPALSLLRYNCSHYNDWIIAFRIEDNKLVVYQIIHSSIAF